MSDLAATVAFFSDPTTATKEIRKSLTSRGLPRAHVDDFLRRLTIHANTVPRGASDAVIQQSVGALWPSLTYAQASILIERMMMAAEAAQAHEQPSLTVLQHLRARDESDDAADIPSVLTRDGLRALTPPLPTEANEALLERLGRGQATSALELKLQRAGATAATVERAKQLRAEAEIVRQLALAGGGKSAQSFEELSNRLLMVASAAAAQVALHMTDPIIAASPGEHVCNQFLGNPAALANIDDDKILEGKGLLVFGLLCQLSDECRFAWRP